MRYENCGGAGHAAGVTRQTIIAIEQGKYCLSLALAFRIAKAFGTGIDDVFKYDRDEAP